MDAQLNSQRVMGPGSPRPTHRAILHLATCMALGVSGVLHVLVLVLGRYYETLAFLVYGMFAVALVGFGLAMFQMQSDGRLSESEPDARFDWAPEWAQRIMTFVGVYVVVGFIWWLGRGGFRFPEVGGPSGFYLSDGKRFIREISEADYWRFRLYQVRAFSGLGVAFLSVATCYFRFGSARD